MPNILSEDHEQMDYEAREKFIQEQPRLFRFAHRAGELWRNRPDVISMHYYYIPVALAAGAFAVGMVDKTFHLHLAKDMAADHAQPHDGWLERTFDGAVHKVGAQAERLEKGK